MKHCLIVKTTKYLSINMISNLFSAVFFNFFSKVVGFGYFIRGKAKKNMSIFLFGIVFKQQNQKGNSQTVTLITKVADSFVIISLNRGNIKYSSVRP